MLAGLRVCSRGGGCENYPRFALTSNQNLVPIVSKLRELIELLNRLLRANRFHADKTMPQAARRGNPCIIAR